MVIRQFLGAFADQTDDKRGPAGLVTGTQALTRFGVEIFVEQNEILPARSIIVSLGDAAAKARPVAVRIGLENRDQTFADKIRDLIECQFASGSSGRFDLERFAVKLWYRSSASTMR